MIWTRCLCNALKSWKVSSVRIPPSPPINEKGPACRGPSRLQGCGGLDENPSVRQIGRTADLDAAQRRPKGEGQGWPESIPPSARSHRSLEGHHAGPPVFVECGGLGENPSVRQIDRKPIWTPAKPASEGRRARMARVNPSLSANLYKKNSWLRPNFSPPQNPSVPSDFAVFFRKLLTCSVHFVVSACTEIATIPDAIFAKLLRGPCPATPALR
jgi:hypothetical protein